jgi:Bacterial toxin homologue of phage lysozyme, C-term
VSNIDFDFISKLEGGQRLDAYVPSPGDSKSGVTIATGFDLGGRDEKALKGLKLPDDLIAKLTPYLGQTGKDAASFVKDNPLKIDKKEADLIDQIARKSLEDTLIPAYDAAVKKPGDTAKFTDLIPEAQAVIASVHFQDQNLAGRTWRRTAAVAAVAVMAAGCSGAAPDTAPSRVTVAPESTTTASATTQMPPPPAVKVTVPPSRANQASSGSPENPYSKRQ